MYHTRYISYIKRLYRYTYISVSNEFLNEKTVTGNLFTVFFLPGIKSYR